MTCNYNEGDINKKIIATGNDLLKIYWTETKLIVGYSGLLDAVFIWYWIKYGHQLLIQTYHHKSPGARENLLVYRWKITDVFTPNVQWLFK